MDSSAQGNDISVEPSRRRSICGLGSLRGFNLTPLRRTASCQLSGSQDCMSNATSQALDTTQVLYNDESQASTSVSRPETHIDRPPSPSGEELSKALPFHSEPKITISNPNAADQSSSDDNLPRDSEDGPSSPRVHFSTMALYDQITIGYDIRDDAVNDSGWPGMDILAAIDFYRTRNIDDFDDMTLVRDMIRLNNDLEGFEVDWAETESGPKNEYDLPGQSTEATCDVCYEQTSLRCRECCSVNACDGCLTSYIEARLNDGSITIPCLKDGCDQPIQAEELSFLLKDSKPLREKFNHLKRLANQTEYRKTCPNCCLLTEIDLNELSNPLVKKYGKRITCLSCGFNWCFKCHTPEHPEVKCKDNRKGSKALVKWTKEFGYGQRNARKCPGCKILIQRNKGCDHMTCKQCDTSFCYKCGGRHRSFRFLGNHWTRWSIFGCPYLMFDGKKKHLRRLIRGSIVAGELALTPLVLALAIAALPLAGVAALFGGPVVGFIKLHHHLRSKRRTKALARRRQDPTVIMDVQTL